MPITVTFDISEPVSQELNQIRGVFERLGWEHLGNTAYRYPKLHGEHPTEDWFNHVIPALMLLRAFACHAVDQGRTLEKFSIDVQTSTGYNPITGVGQLPHHADHIAFSDPSATGKACGLKNLKTWIDGVTWLYGKKVKTHVKSRTPESGG